MKKILSLIVVTLLSISICLSGFIGDIGLSWNNNPGIDFVSKYMVYQAKLPSTNFVPVITVIGTNTVKVRVTSTGTYQFKVSAVNGVGESGLSQAVQVPNVMPTIPTNILVISVTVTNN